MKKYRKAKDIMDKKDKELFDFGVEAGKALRKQQDHIKRLEQELLYWHRLAGLRRVQSDAILQQINAQALMVRLERWKHGDEKFDMNDNESKLLSHLDTPDYPRPDSEGGL